MQLYIKNMVCNRCITVVTNELTELGIGYTSVRLGEVDIPEKLSDAQNAQLRQRLTTHGFEVLDDKKAALISQIKTAVINYIQFDESKSIKVNLSAHIAEKVGKDYNYLSGLFSEVEGITIEKFVILQRIEKVKELLVYGELSLSEIAWKMGYSSLAHLSGQFKKITGLTPSDYREIRDKKRQKLDEL
jgi:AraC family transcriptional regulator